MMLESKRGVEVETGKGMSPARLDRFVEMMTFLLPTYFPALSQHHDDRLW